MARPPGPDCRWIVLGRRSAYNADGTEGSTRRQRLEVSDYIVRNELGVIVRSFSEVASAYRKDVKRDKFEEALALIEAEEADGIAVWKIDRLCRRVSQYRRVLDVLERKGARLLSMVEGIDTADPERKFVNGLILDLLVRLAEMESESTSERILLMQQELRRNGKHHGGGTRPFGHTMNKTKLVEAEADALREAARRINDGVGLWAIIQEWNANGPKPVKAKRWSANVLRDMLSSPRMVAKGIWAGEPYDLEDVEPILDEELWERVRAKLAEPKPHTGSAHTKRMLSAIALCGGCNVTMRGGQNSRANKPIYVCPPKSRGERLVWGGTSQQ